jgi:hypothetical protein
MLSVVFQRTKSLIWNIWVVKITKITAETSITETPGGGGGGGGGSQVRIEWEKQQTSKNVDKIADDKLHKNH